MPQQRTRIRPRSILRLTRLEDRTVPAGASLSLTGGVLRVTDWTPADTVAIHQTAAGVTVTAAGAQQAFTAVSRVWVDVQNTDTVVNDTAGLGGASARQVTVARRNATGTAFVSTSDLAAGATFS